MPSEESARIVVLPVPYDETSTWLKGADQGPAAIIAASANMELFDIETGSEVFRRGIFTGPGGHRKPYAGGHGGRRARAGRRAILEREQFVVTVGGEHSVSDRAASRPTPRAIRIMCRAAARRPRGPARGIRGQPVQPRLRHGAGARALPRSSRSASAAWTGRTRPSLTPGKRLLGARDRRQPRAGSTRCSRGCRQHCYVTIDLDVFDPALMPSTGTPEPGGLFWYDVTRLLQAVSRRCRVVGFDVVELCPSDSNRAPDFLAAKLIYQF
ncbi:MAG: arginase family protein [Desulfosudis oleivorans]|nr:arginase family protein [Desulfosudis oleivorans]